MMLLLQENRWSPNQSSALQESSHLEFRRWVDFGAEVQVYILHPTRTSLSDSS